MPTEPTRVERIVNSVGFVLCIYAILMCLLNWVVSNKSREGWLWIAAIMVFMRRAMEALRDIDRVTPVESEEPDDARA